MRSAAPTLGGRAVHTLKQVDVYGKRFGEGGLIERQVSSRLELGEVTPAVASCVAGSRCAVQCRATRMTSRSLMFLWARCWRVPWTSLQTALGGPTRELASGFRWPSGIQSDTWAAVQVVIIGVHFASWLN